MFQYSLPCTQPLLMWRLYNHWVAKNIRSCPKWNKRCLKFYKFIRDGGARFCKQLADYIMQTDEHHQHYYYFFIFLFLFFVLKLKETSTSFCEVSRSHIRSSSTITECVGLQVYVNACYTKNSRSCKHDWTATEVDRSSCTLTTWVVHWQRFTCYKHTCTLTIESSDRFFGWIGWVVLHESVAVFHQHFSHDPILPKENFDSSLVTFCR